MGYTMIAEVGNLLVEVLRRELVPDVISQKNSIALCSPDNHGDFKLGIYLYDIRENEDVRASGMVNAGRNTQAYPPLYLSLYYMVTAYSDSDLAFRAQEEQKILGKVLQVLRDNNVFSQKLLGGGVSMPARVELMRVENHEKSYIWNPADSSARLSIFYRIQPVEIVSARTREIHRVRDVDFAMQKDGALQRRRFIHASVTVFVVDDFTGRAVESQHVNVSAPGHRPPFAKGDGHYVFMNLSETELTVVCEGRMYRRHVQTLQLAGKDEGEVYIIHLLPGVHYPMPNGAVRLVGRARPGRRYLFWSEEERYKLQKDYSSRIKEGAVWIAIYNPVGRVLEGRRFCIQDRTGKEKEFFRIIGRTGPYYQMEQALLGEYKKIGAKVILVHEVTADDAGGFSLLLAGGEGNTVQVVCRDEEHAEETILSLKAGKENIVML